MISALSSAAGFVFNTPSTISSAMSSSRWRVWASFIMSSISVWAMMSSSEWQASTHRFHAPMPKNARAFMSSSSILTLCTTLAAGSSPIAASSSPRCRPMASSARSAAVAILRMSVALLSR